MLLVPAPLSNVAVPAPSADPLWMNTSLDPAFAYDLLALVIADPSGRLLLPSEVKLPVNVFALYR